MGTLSLCFAKIAIVYACKHTCSTELYSTLTAYHLGYFIACLFSMNWWSVRVYAVILISCRFHLVFNQHNFVLKMSKRKRERGGRIEKERERKV